MSFWIYGNAKYLGIKFVLGWQMLTLDFLTDTLPYARLARPFCRLQGIYAIP